MATISGNVNLSDLEVPGAAEVILLSADCSTVIAETTSNGTTGYYEFTGLPDGNAYRVMVRATGYRSKIFGPVYSSDAIVFDGSTYAGWTLVGTPTPAVDPSIGWPAPSLKVTNGSQYAYIESTIPLNAPATIDFDVMVEGGGQSLFDFVFGANSSGSGPYLRIECRPSNNCGIAQRSSWTSFPAPSVGTTPAVAANVQHHVRIVIKSSTLVDWYLNDVLIAANVPVTINGDYIALSAFATSGVVLKQSNIDNLVIAPGN